MKILRLFADNIERICLIISSIAMVVMASVLVFQVFMRYFLNAATSWSDEVATLMFVWSVMLAIPIGIRRHEHISVEFFISLLKGVPHKIGIIIIQLLTAITIGAVGYFSLGLMKSAGRQLLTGISLALDMRVPMTIMYIAAPIGCFITAFFCLERVLNTLTKTEQWEERQEQPLDEDLQGTEAASIASAQIAEEN